MSNTLENNKHCGEDQKKNFRSEIKIWNLSEGQLPIKSIVKQNKRLLRGKLMFKKYMRMKYFAIYNNFENFSILCQYSSFYKISDINACEISNKEFI